MFKYTNHEVIFSTKSIDGDVTVTKSTWEGENTEGIDYIVSLSTGISSTSKSATFKNIETAMKRAKKYTDFVMSKYSA